MEEKIIIKSRNALKFLSPLITFLLTCAVILFLGMFFFWIQDDFEDFLLFTTPPFIAVIVLLILKLNISNCELTVTDKRIYGKALLGKRVDLPIDSVSAIGTSALKGIDIGTSSGRIKFKLIANSDEIHSVMSKLIIDRQTNKEPVTSNVVSSNADELKKYKDLLDSGVITQEEFDAKKKQLLGL